MYLAMKHMVWYMGISLYLAMKYMVRYMEISMYLENRLLWKHMAGYMDISYLAICFVARYLVSGIAKRYTYQCILAAQRNMEFSVDLH